MLTDSSKPPTEEDDVKIADGPHEEEGDDSAPKDKTLKEDREESNDTPGKLTATALISMLDSEELKVVSVKTGTLEGMDLSVVSL